MNQWLAAIRTHWPVSLIARSIPVDRCYTGPAPGSEEVPFARLFFQTRQVLESTADGQEVLKLRLRLSIWSLSLAESLRLTKLVQQAFATPPPGGPKPLSWRVWPGSAGFEDRGLWRADCQFEIIDCE